MVSGGGLPMTTKRGGSLNFSLCFSTDDAVKFFSFLKTAAVSKAASTITHMALSCRGTQIGAGDWAVGAQELHEVSGGWVWVLPTPVTRQVQPEVHLLPPGGDFVWELVPRLERERECARGNHCENVFFFFCK